LVHGVVVADGDEHAAGTDAETFVFDGWSRWRSWEVLFHFQFGQGMLAAVDLLRNRKDNEESGGEADAGYGGDGFGKILVTATQKGRGRRMRCRWDFGFARW